MKTTFYDLLKNTYQQLLDPTFGMDLNKENIKRLKLTSFDDFVNNRDYCADFIRDVLEIAKDSKMARINRERLTHIFITWLLGIIISHVAFDYR